MMPLAIFVIFALVCQTIIVGISLAIEKFGPQWLSVITFGVLYVAAFAVAWKLTVWAVDTRLGRARAAE
jgi:hypothetical protein